jgi:hypothetical protein
MGSPYMLYSPMTNEHFPYDRTVRELMQHIPKRFTEILFGLKVVEVLRSCIW